MAAFGLFQAHGRALTLSFAFILLFLVSHSYAYGLERSSEKDGLDSRIRSAAMLLMGQQVTDQDFQHQTPRGPASAHAGGSSVPCQLYLPLQFRPSGSCHLPLMVCSQMGLVPTLTRF